MTPDAFRRLALALPQVHESSHLDHPDFRVGKKVFATLGYPDARWGMVKLTPEQQAKFIHQHPAIFSPVKGGWGLRGSTSVKLRLATQQVMQSALAQAWRNNATVTLIKQHADTMGKQER